MKKKELKAPQEPFTLYWRWHDTSYVRRRVWCNSWPGDVFEIVDPNKWGEIARTCFTFNIPLKEAEDN